MAAFLVQLIRHRRRWRALGLPGPPHELVFGHLRLFAEMARKNDGKHLDYTAQAILNLAVQESAVAAATTDGGQSAPLKGTPENGGHHERVGNGIALPKNGSDPSRGTDAHVNLIMKDDGIIFLDLYPFAQPICLVSSPEIADQIVRVDNLPKCLKAMTVHFPIFGNESLALAASDEKGEEHWRTVRRSIAPGFKKVGGRWLLFCLSGSPIACHDIILAPSSRCWRQRQPQNGIRRPIEN